MIAGQGLNAAVQAEDQGSRGVLVSWSFPIADRFTRATGIKVKIVATDENQFSSLITSAAAGGTLPDVVSALPLAAVAQMSTNGLLDTEAAKAIVDQLGAGTFSPRALELTRQCRSTCCATI